MSDETTALNLLRKILMGETYSDLVGDSLTLDTSGWDDVILTPEEADLCKRIWIEAGKLKPE